jgi:hypothetical protein
MAGMFAFVASRRRTLVIGILGEIENGTEPATRCVEYQNLAIEPETDMGLLVVLGCDFAGCFRLHSGWDSPANVRSEGSLG